jgi:hypothetical protein
LHESDTDEPNSDNAYVVFGAAVPSMFDAAGLGVADRAGGRRVARAHRPRAQAAALTMRSVQNGGHRRPPGRGRRWSRRRLGVRSMENGGHRGEGAERHAAMRGASTTPAVVNAPRVPPRHSAPSLQCPPVTRAGATVALILATALLITPAPASAATKSCRPTTASVTRAQA